MRQREPAICLYATDYSETSQVVHFLTRGGGAVRLLAKGTKRPKSKSGGMIDLLAEGDLVFIAGGGESLGTLVEFTETDGHADLRRTSARLNAALYMIELVGEMLAPADPHPEVFELLHGALGRLADEAAGPLAVLAYFQWRLLRAVGVLGELTKCVSCGGALVRVAPRGRSEAYFSSREGGLLCGGCENAVAEKFRVDGAGLAGLAAMAAAESGAKVNLPDKQANSVNRMLAYHVREQLGKRLKMERHAIG
ncbi:MAG: DNA repair protein RecO [Planctomycetota bacterium]|jgi:DNA repair protein RecO (recombination protein O)